MAQKPLTAMQILIHQIFLPLNMLEPNNNGNNISVLYCATLTPANIAAKNLFGIKTVTFRLHAVSVLAAFCSTRSFRMI